MRQWLVRPHKSRIMTPLSIRSPNSHINGTQQLNDSSPYNVIQLEKMLDPLINYPTNPQNDALYSYNTNSFNNELVWKVSIGATNERSEILAWLSPLEPRIRHQDLRTRRADNVGEWLLQTDEFQKWCNGAEHATLLCYGDPAVGKTYLR